MRFARGFTGASTVEAALIAAPILCLLLGIILFGRISFSKSQIRSELSAELKSVESDLSISSCNIWGTSGIACRNAFLQAYQTHTNRVAAQLAPSGFKMYTIRQVVPAPPGEMPTYLDSTVGIIAPGTGVQVIDPDTGEVVEQLTHSMVCPPPTEVAGCPANAIERGRQSLPTLLGRYPIEMVARFKVYEPFMNFFSNSAVRTAGYVRHSINGGANDGDTDSDSDSDGDSDSDVDSDADSDTDIDGDSDIDGDTDSDTDSDSDGDSDSSSSLSSSSLSISSSSSISSESSEQSSESSSSSEPNQCEWQCANNMNCRCPGEPSCCTGEGKAECRPECTGPLPPCCHASSASSSSSSSSNSSGSSSSESSDGSSSSQSSSAGKCENCQCQTPGKADSCDPSCCSCAYYTGGATAPGGGCPTMCGADPTLVGMNFGGCPIGPTGCPGICTPFAGPGGTFGKICIPTDQFCSSSSASSFPTCGDGVCTPPEDPFNCPADCTALPTVTTIPSCGDGMCIPPESYASCPADCGTSSSSSSSSSYAYASCGNAICEYSESPINCPPDCAAPTSSSSAPGIFCGNAVCEPPETSATCPADCAPVSSSSISWMICGDGICQTGEACPMDCGTG